MPEVIRAEGELEALSGQATMTCQTGVVHEHVDAIRARGDRLRRAPDGVEVGEVEGDLLGAGTGGGGDIGVQECDDYLKKMESCLGKMPAEVRSSTEASFKQTRDAWKQAAGTEAGKSGLKQGCQAALDALAQNPMCQ